MIFGFNTDVHVNDVTYHVQTEDRGARNPVVDSVIYVGGKIVDRVRTPYSPEAATQAEIETMVRNQHRAVLESIRSGTFTTAKPAAEPLPRPSGYGLRLENPHDIVKDGQLRFEFHLWNRVQAAPAEGASLDVRWWLDGHTPDKIMLQAGEDGSAVLCLPMPPDQRDITLLVCAKGSEGREIAKFHVRGKALASDK